jgi:hypothetical protein
MTENISFSGDSDPLNRTGGEDSFLNTTFGSENLDLPTDPDQFLATFSESITRFAGGFRRIKEQRVGDRDISKLTPLEKSLNDVRVALRNLQQNIEIPQV